jgi:hypothetical protein
MENVRKTLQEGYAFKHGYIRKHWSLTRLQTLEGFRRRDICSMVVKLEEVLCIGFFPCGQ